MSWFDRQAMSRPQQEVEREHARYIRAAQLPEALDALAGPYGVRRFLIRFARQGVVVRIVAIDAVPLQWGGGPPPADPTGKLQRRVSTALTRLHKNMSLGPRWERGVIGYIRGRDRGAQIMALFDDDADMADISKLPAPPPPGHPLEAPSYHALLAQLEHKMAQIHGRTAMLGGRWDVWDLDGHELVLHYAQEQRRHRCQVLGLQDNRRGRFLWQTDEVLFAEPAFKDRAFGCDWNGANELCLLTAARLDAEWLFVGDLGDERVLFGAVH